MTKYRIKEVFEPYSAPRYYPKKRILGIWINFSKPMYLDVLDSPYEVVRFEEYKTAVRFLDTTSKSIRIYPYPGE